MRPEVVSTWREGLPPPFNQSSPTLNRRHSMTHSKSVCTSNETSSSLLSSALGRSSCRKRRDSAPHAVDQVDRSVEWLRFLELGKKKICQERSDLAIEKLRVLRSSKRRYLPASSSSGSTESLGQAGDLELLRRRSVLSKYVLGEPTQSELSALVYQCFPPIEDSKVVITEYSTTKCRTSEYSLREVLASDCILQPGDVIPRVRWIYVEYYKMGTFWGSDYRFSQWGTDPALFEKSPIVLLQNRLAELDRKSGRPSLEEDDFVGHKRIGKYHREVPGCPEYLGIRVNASAWLESEPYKLLLDYLATQETVCQELIRGTDTDLKYGLAYINAVQRIRESAYHERPGLRELHNTAKLEDVYAYGSWDDNVERLEFYREHTLLSCGSPRFYKTVADRLNRKEDVLRQNPDCALLYYTLARVSIENDEMMQDAPERALNKVFARLQAKRNTNQSHVEQIFNLQQAVIDGLEYLEENKRELPIWGIPPFENHKVCFHPEHSPPSEIRDLIQKEMDLIQKDFDTIIGHWKTLRSKVDRYLDVLLQFRVLEQQELAVSQSHMATQQQILAVDEARSARVQSRSVIIFTAVTIIFLPLSFFTSYFGMNVTDIIATAHSSSYFWLIAGPVSGGIVIAIFALTKLSAIRDPVLDEEKGYTDGKEAASKKTWRMRLGFRRGKVKDS